jgi:hypothetical protein
MSQHERGLRFGSVLARFISIAGGVAAAAMANPAVDSLALAAWRGTPRHVQGLAAIITGTAQAVAVLCAGSRAALVLHELGHYLAARALGEPVKAVYIGSPPSRLVLGRGSTKLHLGLRAGGRVLLGTHPTAGRFAIFVAAGPATNLLTAVVVLAMPLAFSVKYPLTLIFAATALSNLVPHRSRSSRLSDGAKLLQGPARSRAEKAVLALLDDPDWRHQPGAADLLLRGIRLDVPKAKAYWPALAGLLHQAGRRDELLAQHRWKLTLPEKPEQNLVQALHHVEWCVATIPGLPLADANLAGRRLSWVLRHLAAEQRPNASHTLAVIRLRQGLPAEVEPLCEESLTADLEPGQRATVLATIALSRHATGQSGREALDEALALDPDAELVSEAAAALGSNTAMNS